MTAKERELYEGALAGHVFGTEEQVAAELERVRAATGADELLVTTSTYDRTALLDSFGRLARLAGLARTTAPATASATPPAGPLAAAPRPAPLNQGECTSPPIPTSASGAPGSTICAASTWTSRATR
ncbi:hypothetical protein GCM10020254_16250 [Streptomyces goshikiensis]